MIPSGTRLQTVSHTTRNLDVVVQAYSASIPRVANLDFSKDIPRILLACLQVTEVYPWLLDLPRIQLH